jgi:hypothetical protein
MNRSLVRIARGALAAVALLALFCGLAIVPAHAQRFQRSYGGGGAPGEEGRGGVTAVSTGGFIATGVSTTGIAAGSDIYVVRTDNTGALVWSSTYSIGNTDEANDIIECANGDFVIVGYTDNVNSGCPPSRDIFLLRIDPCGRVLWVNTYGTPFSDEIGWEVIEAQSGSPTQFPPTNIGDLIVAGSTTNTPFALRDGYLMRVTAGGGLIWDRQYDVASTDDYFYGLVEATFFNLLGVPDDIVAVGGSGTTANTDGFMVRVSGTNGTIGAAPQNASLYGGTASFEEFRSVCELRNGPAATLGDLVAAGNSTVFSPFGQPDALLVEYGVGNPCLFMSDQIFGDGGGPGADEAYWVREDPFNPPGSVVVTGYVSLPGGLGGNDAFRHSFFTGPLAPIAPPGPWIYGSTGTDRGWSVSPVFASFPCHSPGYVIAGVTNSFNPVAGVNELYLIKSDVAGFTGSPTNPCPFERNVPAIYQIPNLPLRCVSTTQRIIMRWCKPPIRRFCQQWQRFLCYDPDGTIAGFCPGQICPTCIPSTPTPKLVAAPAADDAAAMKLTSFPNPVTRGSDINLEYTASGDAVAIVTVTDMLGREIYAENSPQTAGTHTAVVSTKGWPVGSYLINVEVAGRSGSRHLEVIDK